MLCCRAPLIVWGTLVGFWVIWQMKSLYYDRKKELVRHDWHRQGTVTLLSL